MSTVNEIIDNENLVTDACPHPPIGEERVVEEPESTEKTPIVSTEPSLPRIHQKRTKQSKPKTKPANGRKFYYFSLMCYSVLINDF